MLSALLIEQIESLLAAGNHSIRGITRLVGVDRSSVQAVARGKHRRQQAPPEPELEDVPPARCPQCGVWCHPPCLACQARSIKAGEIKRRCNEGRPAEADPSAELHVELSGNARTRYEALRAKKLAEDDGGPTPYGYRSEPRILHIRTTIIGSAEFPDLSSPGDWRAA